MVIKMFTSRNFVWVFFQSARATLNRILSLSGRAGSHCSARGARCCTRGFPSCGGWASHCAGFSRCGARLSRGQELRCTGLAALQRVEPPQARGRTRVPCTGRQTLNHCTMRGVLGPLFIVSSSCKYVQVCLLI